MLKEKNLSQQNKVKIYQEVNSYLVLQSLEIRLVQHQPIEQIKVAQI